MTLDTLTRFNDLFEIKAKKHRDAYTAHEGLISKAHDELKKLVDEKNRHAEAFNLLLHLRTSWQDDDPGKYGEAVFFLRRGNRVVIRDLVEDEKEVPAHYPRISPEEADKGLCPRCSARAFIVEKYHQTEDTPSGDEWMKQKILLCLGCGEITPQEPHFSPNRF